MHPHIYTNGHVCASILGKSTYPRPHASAPRCFSGAQYQLLPQEWQLTAGPEWSPVLNAVSICLTMQSMLASCKKKEL